MKSLVITGYQPYIRGMFTGIITHRATIEDIQPQEQGMRMRFAVAFDTLPEEGASIACNGCCLTALAVDANGFSADLSPETMQLTTADQWRVGDRVNIERSLRIGDELGGHLVSGHIDGVATCRRVSDQGEYHELCFTAPESLSCFIADKGSVAVNGISLTVNQVTGDDFTVMIIPHTWQVTNLSAVTVGDAVNLEVDRMARYASRLMKQTG